MAIESVMPSDISSFVIPFSSCLQSFPASRSFLMSQLFTSSGQRIGASASASVLPMSSEKSESESCSVMSYSLRPHGLYSPWNSPGRNTGVGSLSLLQGIFPTQGSNPGLPHCRWILYQLSHKGSPRILKQVAYPFSRESSRPRNWTRISCIAGGFFTNWAIREAQWAHQDSCFRLWHKPCHCFHEHDYSGFGWFAARMCIVKHTHVPNQKNTTYHSKIKIKFTKFTIWFDIFRSSFFLVFFLSLFSSFLPSSLAPAK